MAGRPDTKARLTTSLIAGMLLVPVSAVAAFALVGRQGGAESTTTTEVVATTATSAAVAQQVVVEPVTASEADIAAACGPDGRTLVDLEASGAISDVQQAALDALRLVCDEAGLSLAGPPAPPPVVRTVKVDVDGSTTTTTNPASWDDEHEDADHQDEDREDEDHEHEDEDGHEDDEHEDDD